MRIGVPHHVTQRGNRRQIVFFAYSGYRLYCDLRWANGKAADVAVWAWCLMRNSVLLARASGRRAQSAVLLAE